MQRTHYPPAAENAADEARLVCPHYAFGKMLRGGLTQQTVAFSAKQIMRLLAIFSQTRFLRGDLKGMTGKFINFRYSDSFNSKYIQMKFEGISAVFEIKEVV